MYIHILPNGGIPTTMLKPSNQKGHNFLDLSSASKQRGIIIRGVTLHVSHSHLDVQFCSVFYIEVERE